MIFTKVWPEERPSLEAGVYQGKAFIRGNTVLDFPLVFSLCGTHRKDREEAEIAMQINVHGSG